MEKVLSDLREFHRVTDKLTAGAPAVPPLDHEMLCQQLIHEECYELAVALSSRDLAAIAKEMVDVIYVIASAALTYGIPLDLVWNAVHHSNMDKVDPETGKVRRRADGKVLKPEGWVAPNIDSIIRGEVVG